MNYKVVCGNKRGIIEEFLNLPSILYTKETIVQDKKMERELLTEKHILSKYFSIIPFLVVDKTYHKPVARCTLTYYPNDNVAYFGFFECINDQDIANLLLNAVYKKARYDGKKKIVGPVDASFWIKYRLKTNFTDDIPYTSEPYNKNYYEDLLKNAGFNVQNEYISNEYSKIPLEYENEKFKLRYEQFKDKGYKIISPTNETFDNCLEDVYFLITDLYKNFPIYKEINKEDFLELFENYQLVLDFDMVKLVYFENEPVGFFISVPDYGNLTYNINLVNIAKILYTKKHPKKHIMLYMGVSPKHMGLGSVIAHEVVENLKIRGIESVGALIKVGKVTQNYAYDLIVNEHNYALFEKNINKENTQKIRNKI